MALFIYRHTLFIKKCACNLDTFLSPYNGTGNLEVLLWTCFINFFYKMCLKVKKHPENRTNIRSSGLEFIVYRKQKSLTKRKPAVLKG